MNAGVAGNDQNVAFGKKARQISVYLSPAIAALDNNNISASCTRNTAAHPWWAVDLGQEYAVGHVIITSSPDYRENSGSMFCSVP